MMETKTLEERYLGAVTSSHLKMSAERFGSVDLLVASGWCRESLATGLYRVRGEFDNAKGNVRQHQAHYKALHAQAGGQRDLARAQQARMKLGPTLAGKHETAAAALCTRAEAEALTARALILMQLKSLDGVMRALRHFAEQQASRRGFAGADVYRVTGHALDLMLDPLCPHCDGVGFFGGFGKPKVLCAKCKGSKRRKIDFGSIETQAFGVFLLADMERKLARVEGLMLNFLSRVRAGDDVPLDASLVSAAEIDLKRRLVELRSPQANSD